MSADTAAGTAAATTPGPLPPFKLERFFAQWEFNAKLLLCCSDRQVDLFLYALRCSCCFAHGAVWNVVRDVAPPKPAIPPQRAPQHGRAAGAGRRRNHTAVEQPDAALHRDPGAAGPAAGNCPAAVRQRRARAAGGGRPAGTGVPLHAGAAAASVIRCLEGPCVAAAAFPCQRPRGHLWKGVAGGQRCERTGPAAGAAVRLPCIQARRRAGRQPHPCAPPPPPPPPMQALLSPGDRVVCTFPGYQVQGNQREGSLQLSRRFRPCQRLPRLRTYGTHVCCCSAVEPTHGRTNQTNAHPPPPPVLV